MNRKLLFLALALLSCLGACTKTGTCTSDENAGLTPPLAVSFLSDSVRVTPDGALQFLSPGAYFRMIDTLATLSPRELDAWETAIGFRSTRAAVNRLLERVARATSDDEIAAIVQQNPRLLAIRDLGVEPLLTTAFYRTITNEAGYFYVGNARHEVTEDRLNIYFTEEATRSATPSISLPYFEEGEGEGEVATRTPADMNYYSPTAGSKSGDIGTLWHKTTSVPDSLLYCQARYAYRRNLVSSSYGTDPVTNQAAHKFYFNYILELSTSAWKRPVSSTTYYTYGSSTLHLKEITFTIENYPYTGIQDMQSPGSSSLLATFYPLMSVYQTSTSSDLASCYMYKLVKVYFATTVGTGYNDLVMSYEVNNVLPVSPSINGSTSVVVVTQNRYSLPVGYEDYEWELPSSNISHAYDGKNKVDITFNATGTYELKCRVKQGGQFSAWKSLTVTVQGMSAPVIAGKTKIPLADMPGAFTYAVTNHATTGGYTSYQWDIPAGVTGTVSSNTREATLSFPDSATHVIRARGVKGTYTSPWGSLTVQTGIWPPPAPVIDGPEAYHRTGAYYSMFTSFQQGDTCQWEIVPSTAFTVTSAFRMNVTLPVGTSTIKGRIKRDGLFSAWTEKVVHVFPALGLQFSWSGDGTIPVTDTNRDMVVDNVQHDHTITGRSSARNITLAYTGSLTHATSSPASMDIQDPGGNYITTVYSANSTSPFTFTIPDDVPEYLFTFPTLLPANATGNDRASALTLTAYTGTQTVTKQLTVTQKALSFMFAFNLSGNGDLVDEDIYLTVDNSARDGYIVGTSTAKWLVLYFWNIPGEGVVYGDPSTPDILITDMNDNPIPGVVRFTNGVSYFFKLPDEGMYQYKFLFPIHVTPNNTNQERQSGLGIVAVTSCDPATFSFGWPGVERFLVVNQQP